MKNKLLKIVTLIIILGVIVLGIIFCLVFQLRTENESKKNNAEYNDTNIISFSIKSNIEYKLSRSDFIGHDLQVAGVVNFINEEHILIRGNATSELDSKVETEFGTLEAADIYLGDDTKILDYTTGKEISINDIEEKDIVIVSGDVYETEKYNKIVDTREGTVRRLRESDYEKMEQNEWYIHMLNKIKMISR